MSTGILCLLIKQCHRFTAADERSCAFMNNFNNIPANIALINLSFFCHTKPL